MSEFKVVVSGLDGLEQKLRDEPKKVAVKVLRKAAKDAAEIWVPAIEALAPELTGFLKSEIVEASKSKSGSEGGIQVLVGPSKRAYYATFREFGTRYQAARPFVRPAFEATKDQVLAAFVEDLQQGLEDLKE
jgi:HK97 gp10 family phage protein